MKHKIKGLGIALAGVCALALSSTAANASAVITPGVVTPIPSNNNFQAELNGLGYFNYGSTGATITLTGPSMLTFDFLGSESGYDDTLTAGSVTYTEHTTFVDDFSTPILLGSQIFAAGSLSGLLNFTSNLGVAATVGDGGFGIFLPSNTGLNTNVFYIGYDDLGAGPDDNHDDFVARVTVAAVPEPATWAMMLLGFGAMGLAVRRARRKVALAQLA